MNTIAKAAEESTDMFCFPYHVFLSGYPLTSEVIYMTLLRVISTHYFAKP